MGYGRSQTETSTPVHKFNFSLFHGVPHLNLGGSLPPNLHTGELMAIQIPGLESEKWIKSTFRHCMCKIRVCAPVSNSSTLPSVPKESQMKLTVCFHMFV